MFLLHVTCSEDAKLVGYDRPRECYTYDQHEVRYLGRGAFTKSYNHCLRSLPEQVV